jgi:hypothetical protein
VSIDVEVSLDVDASKVLGILASLLEVARQLVELF